MSADVGNIKGMYDGLKQAIGSTQYKTAPLQAAAGEVITDRAKPMERWVEHDSELCCRENTVSEAALNAIDRARLWTSSTTSRHWRNSTELH